ncbi:hypothetical protein [Mycobacterium hubeiense]|uniref:hypothetical protein n=1 Tax=Mycobacterium hubeiense TaxID=1867256 RepID=UPI000C7EABD9|nr:hypothetical protein [Mycobacterium sp. QGD 101]
MNDDERRWLDEPHNVTRIVYGLFAMCTVALVADLFYTKHPYFDVERLPGFYAVYGFVVSLTLVLTAKQLRKLLRRNEDYYEPAEEPVDEPPRRDGDDR